MYTPDEICRMAEVERINSEAGDRAILEARYGKVWSSNELRAEFQARGFGAPYIRVRRLSDGKCGTLEFQHAPRFYFNWREET